MSALTFTLKGSLDQRLNVSSLNVDHLKDLDIAAIKVMKLPLGNRSIALQDLFSVEGNDPTEIIFRGKTHKLDKIGQGMTSGLIRVEGDAGSYLGMHMKGGEIRVKGSVDAYGACEMKNGLILIEGHAGDFLGAALPGNKKGMAGGMVHVKGNVGARAGDHMRRGLLVIDGDTGDYLGSRMTAGTIAVLGRTGRYLGYAMGRGTLLLATPPQEILPTFQDCGSHTLGFIPLLLKSLKALDTPLLGMSDQLKRVRRYAGDMCGLGKGEILVATN
ncbi:MAG: formylmethanofuran dehydrogenase subunit C [Gammaproteobacteria bacterium]|nr:formylmethanofuran dehydrogenase subunit C [Gammaproteobacteria bacterium]NBT45731.1 formylmethanofuran dehydrogenase subunit C [Gammaproteobacteria bacterium]